jgi:hypothetical protein
MKKENGKKLHYAFTLTPKNVKRAKKYMEIVSPFNPSLSVLVDQLLVDFAKDVEGSLRKYSDYKRQSKVQGALFQEGQ